MNNIIEYKLFEYETTESVMKKVLDSTVGTVLEESDIYQYVEFLHRNEEDFIDGDLGDRIEKFPFYKLTEVSISDINIDEWELDDDKVDEYIKKLKKNKGTYPAIVLSKSTAFGEKNRFTVIDGTHRANALDRAGIKTIRAWVGQKKR